jgi:hypothetical protein
MSLAEILREDTWKTLHPATKLVIKILQHIKDKIKDGAEVRAYFDEDELTITTYKSEVRITRSKIEFKRRERSSLRVQRLKLSRELSKEVLDVIKRAVVDILECDYEPDYQLIVEVLEKHLTEESDPS